MQLADTDDLALWYALNRLMTNYWADVDGNSGSQAHEFYLSDALRTAWRKGDLPGQPRGFRLLVASTREQPVS